MSDQIAMTVIDGDLVQLSPEEQTELDANLADLELESTEHAIRTLIDRHKVEFTLLKGEYKREIIDQNQESKIYSYIKKYFLSKNYA